MVFLLLAVTDVLMLTLLWIMVLLSVENASPEAGLGITLCLVTKQDGPTGIFVQPEQCPAGVKHCLITLSVTNRSADYTRHSYYCWPWPELESHCPTKLGVCQLLHQTDDQLHLTCCCLGSMCNNGSLKYMPLRNESTLSIELRSRLETFGLRDHVDGQNPAAIHSHSELSAWTDFWRWIPPHGPIPVLVCLVVLIVVLCVGLIGLARHFPGCQTATWSRLSLSHRASLTSTNNTDSGRRNRFLLFFLFPSCLPCRGQLQPIERKHYKTRPSRTWRHRPTDIFKCCFVRDALPCNPGAQNCSGPPNSKTKPQSSDALLDHNWSPQHGSQDEQRNCPAFPFAKSHGLGLLKSQESDFCLGPIRTGSLTDAVGPGNNQSTFPFVQFSAGESPVERSATQNLIETCELLRFLGQGRFARVWLAKSSEAVGVQLNADHVIPLSHCTDPSIDDFSPQRKSVGYRQPLTCIDQSGYKSTVESIDFVALKMFPPSEQRAWENELVVFQWLTPVIKAYTQSTNSASNSGFRNVIQFFGAGKIKNEYRLAMEYASQGSLRGLLDRGEWLSLEHVIRLARDIVRGLCFLHADYPTSNKPSIAHRDVKPENILIRSDGSACLSDFGQATVLDSRTSDDARTNSRADHVASNTTSTGSTSHGMNLEAVPKAGTLRYMAPEILDGAIQFTGCSILCTDVYSVALCLWELLTAVAVYPTPVDLAHCDSNPRVADFSHLSSDARISDAHRRVWLPYERELGRHGLDPEELRHLVSVRKHRPCPCDAWFESPLYAQFYRTIAESWDSEPEARLSANCILERLNFIQAQSVLNTDNSDSNRNAMDVLPRNQIAQSSSQSLAVSDGRASTHSDRLTPLAIHVDVDAV